MAAVDSLPIIPQRRPRPVDVIDVDSLMDNEISYTGFALSSRIELPDDQELSFTGFRRSQRRRISQDPGRSAPDPAEVIVLDSDDEQVSSGGAPRGRRNRLVSPPPPRMIPLVLPPVPPVPRHLAGQGSFPAHLVRARNPIPVPPPVLPNLEPFPFEVHIREPLRRIPAPPAPPPAAAAPSHHQPVMGLGGALIAMNRNAAVEASDRERGRPRALPERGSQTGFWGFLRNLATGRFLDDPTPQNSPPPPARSTRWSRLWQDFAGLEGDLPQAADFEDSFVFHEFHAGAGVLPSRKHEATYYKSSFTHPEKPMPGFTYDFTPAETSSTSGTSSPAVIVLDDDEPGTSSNASASGSSSSSTVAVETTLVCARCLDPLVIGILDEKRRKTSRVFALRCGHMLDGKCIDALMRPPFGEPVLEDIKGKGKARADPDEALVVELLTEDRKGKRKAVEMAAPADLPLVSEPAFADDSIRSRLRPRHPPASDVAMAVDPPALSSPERPVRALPRRRQANLSAMRGKGKGKGKARAGRKPIIEAEHSWMCPVTGCGRVHVSVRVDGVWKMDEERGAIAAFI